MFRRIVTVGGILAALFVLPECRAQVFELTCPAGTTSVQQLQTTDTITGKLRQNYCVDPTGKVFENTSGALNNIIIPDPSLGSSALQSAIISCSAFPNGCTVDASSSTLGTQTLTQNPFALISTPIKLITGPYTIQYDATAFFIDLPNDSSVIGYGTIWLNSTAQSLAALVTDTSGRSSQQITGILNNRIYGTTGSITAGTATLTVSSASNLRIGQTIAILGAAGGMTSSQQNQTTTINQGGGIGTGDTSVTVVTTNNPVSGHQAFGNSVYQDNYILIDSEIISYSGITATSFTGLSRGLFGTAAATHANGATVAQLASLVTEIMSISGNTITLMDNATFTVSSSFIQAGALNIFIGGSATFDANYINRAGLPTNGSNLLDGISFLLGSQEVIEQGIRFQNSAHGGVFLEATRKSKIGGSYRHIGRPPNNFGFDVWLFASSISNTIQTSSHVDSDGGVLIDDRSDTVVRWSNGSNDNVISLGGMNTKTISFTTCLGIEGSSSRNIATIGYCNANAIGFGSLELVSSQQWTTTPIPTSNVINFSSLDSAGTAINAGGGANNQFRGGAIPTGTISCCTGTDPTDSLIYQDSRNDNATRFLGLRFSPNLISGPGSLTLAPIYASTFSRSGGATGFPDIIGNGSAAVVIGDANGERLNSPILTNSNCSSSVSPAVCTSSSAGSVTIAAAATTIQVNTTAVTANSQISITEDSSLGTKLGVTCNTVTGRTYTITTRTAATSFVITASAAPAANPACLSYSILN